MVSYASRKKQGNPGVAKFGIALEWGSRGRWFESSHSDQEIPICTRNGINRNFLLAKTGVCEKPQTPVFILPLC